MTLFTKSYAELVRLGKDAARDLAAPLRAKEMKLKAQMRMAELESLIATNEQKMSELASAYPIDFDKLIAAMDETALHRRRHEQLGQIVNELFPDVATPAPAAGA